MYSGEIGRFLQVDPVDDWGFFKLYEYCRNNPLKYSDPWGEKPGDRYLTEEAAAKDAFKDISEKSKKIHYAGSIDKNSDGTYSYTKAIPGNKDNVVAIKTNKTTAFYLSQPRSETLAKWDYYRYISEKVNGYWMGPKGIIYKFEFGPPQKAYCLK